MNHASLFSGIGGFDLAAREVGWNNDTTFIATTMIKITSIGNQIRG